MSDYREDCIERKSVRAGIIEQKSLKTRNKRPRPFIVECCRHKDAPFYDSRKNPWKRWGAYRTAEEADKALQTLSRKYQFYDWRRPPVNP
jgi:hypothetical protein